MRYVVDGCNLLGADGALGKPGADRSLLAAVERFCRLSASTAIVVFDAMEGRDPGSEYRFGERVWARCAPAGRTSNRADREIVSEVRRRRDAVVVTDDGALARGVRQLGVAVMDCATFRRRLDSAVVAVGEKDAAAVGIDNDEFLRLWVDQGR